MNDYSPHHIVPSGLYLFIIFFPDNKEALEDNEVKEQFLFKIVYRVVTYWMVLSIKINSWLFVVFKYVVLHTCNIFLDMDCLRYGPLFALFVYYSLDIHQGHSTTRVASALSNKFFVYIIMLQVSENYFKDSYGTLSKAHSWVP